MLLPAVHQQPYSCILARIQLSVRVHSSTRPATSSYRTTTGTRLLTTGASGGTRTNDSSIHRSGTKTKSDNRNSGQRRVVATDQTGQLQRPGRITTTSVTRMTHPTSQREVVVPGNNRPISPHASTFSFPIVALSKATTRWTGVVLSLSLGTLSTIELALPLLGNGNPSTGCGGGAVALLDSAVQCIYQYLPSPFICLLKGGLSFLILHHWTGGLLFSVLQPQRYTGRRAGSISIMGSTQQYTVSPEQLAYFHMLSSTCTATLFMFL